ncbi:MAG: hypothetical protein ACX93U_21830 [Salipiger thiooxidans]|uniref:hypothetical protein n=1 Tax=Salipiger thiooxidans TaxID=282683 RepID=UPI001CFA29A7|nr:hypothetical protein [Salipiger thiooxidans]
MKSATTFCVSRGLGPRLRRRGLAGLVGHLFAAFLDPHGSGVALQVRHGEDRRLDNDDAAVQGRAHDVLEHVGGRIDQRRQQQRERKVMHRHDGGAVEQHAHPVQRRDPRQHDEIDHVGVDLPRVHLVDSGQHHDLGQHGGRDDESAEPGAQPLREQRHADQHHPCGGRRHGGVAEVEVAGHVHRQEHHGEGDQQRRLAHRADTGKQARDHASPPQSDAMPLASRTVQAPSASSLSTGAALSNTASAPKGALTGPTGAPPSRRTTSAAVPAQGGAMTSTGPPAAPGAGPSAEAGVMPLPTRSARASNRESVVRRNHSDMRRI